MITAQLATWRTELFLTVRATASSALERELSRLLGSEVARLDRLASRSRPDSELSAVNAAAGAWVEVSWDFVAVLDGCLRAADHTDGLVDPTLGCAVVAAGYDEWAGETPLIEPAAQTGRWQEVGIRPGRREAQVLIPADSALDLGSIAKSWLADRLARAVAASGYEVCANMGGDLRVIADEPWTVWTDPELPGEDPASVTINDGGVATSGIGRRRWTGGHHLIDPRTGTPAATRWHSVSVVAATATDANAAATAAVILGDDGPAWLADTGLDGRFVAPDRVACVGRWTHEEDVA